MAAVIVNKIARHLYIMRHEFDKDRVKSRIVLMTIFQFIFVTCFLFIHPDFSSKSDSHTMFLLLERAGIIFAGLLASHVSRLKDSMNWKRITAWVLQTALALLLM